MNEFLFAYDYALNDASEADMQHGIDSSSLRPAITIIGHTMSREKTELMHEPALQTQEANIIINGQRLHVVINDKVNARFATATDAGTFRAAVRTGTGNPWTELGDCIRGARQTDQEKPVSGQWQRRLVSARSLQLEAPWSLLHFLQQTSNISDECWFGRDRI